MAKKKSAPKDKVPQRSILINFVLDKSGSMDVIRDATISGFNEFKNDQRQEEGVAFFTLTLFDTEFSTVCSAVPIETVRDLTYETYRPGGMTALYDAIGYTMRITDQFVEAHSPDQVLFVIMSDGLENASREFTRERIFAMIKDRQDRAEYEFMYLGANQDSYAEGNRMGIDGGRMLDYAATGEGSKAAFARASANVRAHRRHGTKKMGAFFAEEVETLGNIDPAVWKSMSEADRAALISKVADGGAGRR